MASCADPRPPARGRSDPGTSWYAHPGGASFEGFVKSHSFSAMGTSWWVACEMPGLLIEAESVVRGAEAQLSRFLPDSALSVLNRDRVSNHALLAQVVGAAIHLREVTGGAFDPTLGERLAKLGYDRTFSAIERPHPPVAPKRREVLSVHVDGARVWLSGQGNVDLGGIAKGFTVDLVIERLVALGATHVLVDGGGDLRGVGGPWPIGVGDGLAIGSDVGAVATSSTRRRTWRSTDGAEHHHILDPRTQASAGTLSDAVIVSATAAMADGLATATIACADRVLPLVAELGAHALVRARDGAWWSTPGFPFAGRGAYEPSWWSGEILHD